MLATASLVGAINRGQGSVTGVDEGSADLGYSSMTACAISACRAML